MRQMKFALAGAAGFAAAMFSAGLARADVTIEYWQYFFQQRVDAMTTLIANFEKANPGVHVKMTHFPYDDYRTKVSAAIPAGEGPDVVQLYYGWLNDYINAGLIQPLPADQFPPDQIDKDFFPMVQAMKRDGKYMALPTAVRALALFYNKRLMKEAGIDAPPATLDEFVADAKKMTKADGSGNITQEGFASGMTAQDHQWMREVLFRQFGTAPYSDDGKTVAYDNDKGAAALKWYTGLQMTEKVTANTFMDEAQAAFKAGRAGLMVDGSFRIGALNATKGLEWGVAELPTVNGVKSNYASYWVNAITSQSKGEKLAAAEKFMAYITSDEAMQVWLKTVGELPAKPAAAMTPENQADPVYGPFIKGLGYAHATVFADESAQRNVLVDAVNRVFLEGADPAASLHTAAEAEQKILDKYYGK
jgi:multiple sugar transport system substrate-binding protein